MRRDVGSWLKERGAGGEGVRRGLSVDMETWGRKGCRCVERGILHNEWERWFAGGGEYEQLWDVGMDWQGTHRK